MTGHYDTIYRFPPRPLCGLLLTDFIDAHPALSQGISGGRSE